MFGFFRGAPKERVALVDISSSSVRAGYALLEAHSPIRILFETKIRIEGAGAEDTRMLRAMDVALRDLRNRGAPLVRKAAGSGSASKVYVSVCAPWQRATLRTHSRIDEKPFTVTEALFKDAFATSIPAQGEVMTEETIVATLLNGYHTNAPLGKRALRAELILLSAVMAEGTYDIMHKTLASFSADRRVRFTTFASMIFRAITDAFPYEREYVAIRVSGEATELVIVKQGFPLSTHWIGKGINVFARAARTSGTTAVDDAAQGIIDREKNKSLDMRMARAEQEWTSAIEEPLRDFAASHALPRTVFLLADDEAHGLLSRLLNTPNLHRLWLSDEPLSIRALDSKHFSNVITRDTPFSGNVPLDLLALNAASMDAQ